MVKIICDKLSVNFDDIVKFSEDRLGKDKSYRMVSTKAKEKLNWSPRYNLDKGIDEYNEGVSGSRKSGLSRMGPQRLPF